MTDRDPWCGESLAGHLNGLCHCQEILALRQQLAETKAHLEAQRLETYRAVEREQRAKRELAEVTKLIERLVMTEEDARWVASRMEKQP